MPPLVAVNPIRRGSTPPELVAEALAPRPGGRVTGEPLSLLAALSSTTERRRQREIARAYWRLAEAVANYNFALDHHRRLQQLRPDAEETGWRAAGASSAASLCEAEVAAVAAQHRLAAGSSLAADRRLPLPADRPHVGPYHTRFERLLALGVAPAGARRIDRTLPIRSRAIQQHASAVEAAEAALSAAVEGYREGQRPPEDAWSCCEALLGARVGLMAAVCRYNEEIAEYALAVASPTASGPTLVAMLIRPGPDTDGPPAIGGSAGQREGTTRASDAAPARSSEPTAASEVPQPGSRPSPASGSIPAPASQEPDAAGGSRPTRAPRPSERDAGSDAEAPSRGSEAKPADTIPTPRVVPIEPLPEGATSHTVNRPTSATLCPPSPASTAGPAVAALALYPGLVQATPSGRVKQLALHLHWDVALPEGIGSPLRLEECLASSSRGNRLELIRAFWRTRQRAAEYQVLIEQAQLLDSLVVADQEPLARLRARAARLATAAAVHDAHAALFEAQADLAARMGRESEAVWPLPSTVPHSGGYLLKLDARPPELIASWPLRRLAAMIPSLNAALKQQAAAVVEADVARASVEADSEAGRAPVEMVCAAIHRQTEQTLRFLRTLTQYNLAIAEYALMVLPPETPSETVAATLVIRR